jgi:hypothetical protein
MSKPPPSGPEGNSGPDTSNDSNSRSTGRTAEVPFGQDLDEPAQGEMPGNGSTGDQIGGQSPNSEAEMDGKTKGLPKR